MGYEAFEKFVENYGLRTKFFGDDETDIEEFHPKATLIETNEGLVVKLASFEDDSGFITGRFAPKKREFSPISDLIPYAAGYLRDKGFIVEIKPKE